MATLSSPQALEARAHFQSRFTKHGSGAFLFKMCLTKTTQKQPGLPWTPRISEGFSSPGQSQGDWFLQLQYVKGFFFSKL